MSTESLHPEKEYIPEYTHIMIVKMPGEKAPKPPVYHHSLKDASDDGDELLKKHPDAECDIYQIRTRLRGKVEILRKDYNSSKSE